VSINNISTDLTNKLALKQYDVHPNKISNWCKKDVTIKSKNNDIDYLLDNR
jgi:hypothetical protein